MFATGRGAPERGANIIAVAPSFRFLTPQAKKAIDGLKPRQRAYLRLVAEGFQTKEIARQLSVSPDRVNKVVAFLCRRLGVEARREAGRMYIEWERAMAPQPPTHSLASHSVGLGQPSPDMPDDAVVNSAPAPEQQARPIAEGQVSYSLPQAMPDLLDLMPLRRSGRPSNDLTMHSTLIVIARLMVGALMAVASALSLLSNMTALLRG